MIPPATLDTSAFKWVIERHTRKGRKSPEMDPTSTATSASSTLSATLVPTTTSRPSNYSASNSTTNWILLIAASVVFFSVVTLGCINRITRRRKRRNLESVATGLLDPTQPAPMARLPTLPRYIPREDSQPKELWRQSQVVAPPSYLPPMRYAALQRDKSQDSLGYVSGGSQNS
ncbi:hypothetical protein BJ742DRAFT_743236 [Cladochytrium replicatum]|nr:hypothetical protein BJ742DRAFT_743236 [Cladochytrium replicatum]